MQLNRHSHFSFKYGVIPPEALIKKSVQAGESTAILTDINSTSGCLQFIRSAQKNHLNPVVGVDFRNGAQMQFLAIAQNNEGFQEINAFLSMVRTQKTPVPKTAPRFENVVVVYPLDQMPSELRTNEFVGLRPEQAFTFHRNLKFKPFLNKAVALKSGTFQNKQDYNLHKLLRAIDNNVLGSRLAKEEVALPNDDFIPHHELKAFYGEYDFLVDRSAQIIRGCRVHFGFDDEVQPQNKRTFYGSDQKDEQRLTQLAHEGLSYRYPKVTPEVKKRLQTELELIVKKGFTSYFLITHDFVSFARRKGYFYVGRGSGANSLVAYLLRITDVDPIELNLYFERFINMFRTSPPDFDMDFSWKNRQDVTRYIFEKHGLKHTALLGAYVTFQFKAALRETAKVFGLPADEIEAAAHLQHSKDAQEEPLKSIFKYAGLLVDMPKQLTVHAGGILISQKPIHYFSATDLPPKGFPTVHFDMIAAEDVGLYKYDVLGQRGLAKIADAFDLIKKNHPHADFDIHDIAKFKKDEKIKSLLREGKTIGCFYVESPAMRMILKKLRVDDYLGLVAASSIIRPGVSSSGMMREYIKRFRDPEERKNAHPVLQKIMPETFGIMVYQEDVIKVAHQYGGLTLGEADVLRRGMSGKYRSREEFQRVKDAFFNNCIKKGEPLETITEIWKQIESFAGYAFAKGHSASYAVESYQSLFLKAHYPIEYMVSTTNNGGGFYRPHHYLFEAVRHGATIEMPCVNKSESLNTLYSKVIFLGLSFVKGLTEKLVVSSIEERRRNGEFTSLEDFIDRVCPGTEDIDKLIRIRAFRFTGKNKRELLWRARGLITPGKRESAQKALFKTETKNYVFPDFDIHPLEHLFDEIELLGFTLHPKKLLAQKRADLPLTTADFPYYKGKEVELVGYLVNIKPTRTANRKRMYFGTFYDKCGEWLDTVHFPGIQEKYPFRGEGYYVIKGLVTEDFGVYALEVKEMHRLPFIKDVRYEEASGD